MGESLKKNIKTVLEGGNRCRKTIRIFSKKNSWSLIKDKLLGHYLESYFQKVLMTGKPIFYVDCFTGKGKFQDGNPGLPLIALEKREDCLKRTKRTEKLGAIKTCFIDLNYAKELKENVLSV